MEYYIIILLMVLSILVGINKSENILEKFANYWYCPIDNDKTKMYTNVSKLEEDNTITNVGSSINTKWGYNFNI